MRLWFPLYYITSCKSGHYGMTKGVFTWNKCKKTNVICDPFSIDRAITVYLFKWVGRTHLLLMESYLLLDWIERSYKQQRGRNTFRLLILRCSSLSVDMSWCHLLLFYCWYTTFSAWPVSLISFPTPLPYFALPLILSLLSCFHLFFLIVSAKPLLGAADVVGAIICFNKLADFPCAVLFLLDMCRRCHISSFLG